MARSPDGKIWVARDGRVSVLERGQLRLLSLGGAAATYPYVQGIGASRDGGLWIASDGRIRKWKDGKWVEGLQNASWGWSPVTRLMETRDGVLAPERRIMVFFWFFPANTKNRCTLIIPVVFHPIGSFPCTKIRKRNLWAGTGGGGLVILRPNNIETVSPPDQWQGRAVLSVCPGRDDALWIGTEGAGLYRYAKRWLDQF